MKRDTNNTMAHVEDNDAVKTESDFSYDPAEKRPTENMKKQPANLRKEATGNDPLEQRDPDKGYSTNPEQSITESSLHLADEDMDVSSEDPIEKANDMKESFKMYKSEDKKDEK